MLSKPKETVGWDASCAGNMCRMQGYELSGAYAEGAEAGCFNATIESSSLGMLLREQHPDLSAEAIDMACRMVTPSLGTWMPTRLARLAQRMLAQGGACARAETSSCVTAHPMLNLPPPEADEDDDDYVPPPDEDEVPALEPAAPPPSAAAVRARHEEARAEHAATLCLQYMVRSCAALRS